MKRFHRFFLFLLIIVLALGDVACNFNGDPERASEQSSPVAVMPTLESAKPDTPQPPEVDVIAVPDTPAPESLPPTPSPTPTPPPTPTPEPTPIPFSYYAPTVNMSFEELVGSLDDFDESNPKSNDTFRMPLGYPAPDTYRIIVDLYWQVVMVYTKDETGAYTVPVRYMLCSSGDPHKYYETTTGVFKMKPTKVRFGNFKTGETAQYWSLIRSRTYFHSTLYSKYRDLSSVDKASYEALAAGKKASHACIRLTVPDARWIFYNISYDTEVEIRKGSKDDAETQAIREKLHLAPWKDNADLSVANTPYTDNWTIEDVKIEVPYVHATQPPVPKS